MKGSTGPDRQIAPGAVAAIWRASRGFTLLEMLAVVTILGILMMSAQAAWWQHVARVRRSDATVALLGLAAAQGRIEDEHPPGAGHAVQAFVPPVRIWLATASQTSTSSVSSASLR